MWSVSSKAFMLRSGRPHQKAAKLCQVVVGLVEDPAERVEVQLDLVSHRQVREADLPRHAVAVVVGVVLVVDAGDLLAVPADGHERLLEVVRADVEREEVEALDGRSEHAGLGVHALAGVHRARAGKKFNRTNKN